jgi:ParB-like chromosome segregation protein Spo0J
MEVNIKDIRVPEGRRPLDRAKVAEIAASIKVVGLLSPIGIRWSFRKQLADGTWKLLSKGTPELVFGWHRLEACRSLGWEKIAVVQKDEQPEEDLDDSAAEMMEIAENLHRSDLTTSQRNEHLAAWVDLLEKRKPDIEAPASISKKKPGRKPSPAVAAVRESFRLRNADC